MSEPLRVECAFHIERQTRGRQRIQEGLETPPPCEPGRILRAARWLALAHKLDALVREGVVKDYAELARLGHVSRARVSQILNLLLLAPDIQEELLFWPRIHGGRDPVLLADLQPIALTPDWKLQRRLWQALRTR